MKKLFIISLIAIAAFSSTYASEGQLGEDKSPICVKQDLSNRGADDSSNEEKQTANPNPEVKTVEK